MGLVHVERLKKDFYQLKMILRERQREREKVEGRQTREIVMKTKE